MVNILFCCLSVTQHLENSSRHQYPPCLPDASMCITANYKAFVIVAIP